jgi:hypothetical protein
MPRSAREAFDDRTVNLLSRQLAVVSRITTANISQCFRCYFDVATNETSDFLLLPQFPWLFSWDYQPSRRAKMSLVIS